MKNKKTMRKLKKQLVFIYTLALVFLFFLAIFFIKNKRQT